MPWYTDINSLETYNAFAKWLNQIKGEEGCGYNDNTGNRRSMSGLMQFWAWTYDLANLPVPGAYVKSTWQGDKQGQVASHNAHLAEAVLSYFKSAFVGKSTQAALFLQAVPTVAERTRVAFEQAAVTAGNHGVNFVQLCQQIVALRGEVSLKLQELWERYAMELDVAVFGEEMEAISFGPVSQGLEKLRSHQKEKLDGGKKAKIFKKGAHRKGKFFLLQKAKDQQPLLLVSSKIDKEVSQEWKNSANTLCSALNKNVVEGVWSQDQDYRFIYFGVERNPHFASVELFQAALQAIGVQRVSVELRPPERIKGK